MKRFSLISGIAFFLMIGIGAWAFYSKSISDTHAIYLDKAELENGTFTTNGSFTGGAAKFAGYEYKIEGKNLYVSIKNRLFIGKSGDFIIEIKDDRLEGTKNVYLLGKSKSDLYQLIPSQEG